MRSGTIALIRSLLRQAGYRLAPGSSERVPGALARLALPAAAGGDDRAAAADGRDVDDGDRRRGCAAGGAGATADPMVQRLQSVPGVGPVVALTFRAFVDDVGRFAQRRPGECGDRAGAARRQFGGAPPPRATSPKRARASCAACWCRRRGRVGAVTASATLRAWVERLAGRRGKRIAVVALARRLSRILFALWRDQSVFDAATLAAA